jgi:hypothetical protein
VRLSTDRQHIDVPARGTWSWPGPVGWWYIPLIWLIVLLLAALGWLSH